MRHLQAAKLQASQKKTVPSMFFGGEYRKHIMGI